MSEVGCGQTELRQAGGSGSGPPLRGLRLHRKPKETERGGKSERFMTIQELVWLRALIQKQTKLTNKHNSCTVRTSLLRSSEIATLIAVKIHTPVNTHIDANVCIANSNKNELKTTDIGETV